MTTRRSFFTRLAQAAAIVALAPQLAFRAPPIRFIEPIKVFRYQGEIDIFTDKFTKDQIQAQMMAYYAACEAIHFKSPSLSLMDYIIKETA